jgi:hypothetical protein
VSRHKARPYLENSQHKKSWGVVQPQPSIKFQCSDFGGNTFHPYEVLLQMTEMQPFICLEILTHNKLTVK